MVGFRSTKPSGARSSAGERPLHTREQPVGQAAPERDETGQEQASQHACSEGGRDPSGRDRTETPADFRQSPCAKCGSSDIRTSYHAQGCPKKCCSCSRCNYDDHNKRHDEHLHRYCRCCHYDWTNSVLGKAA